MWHFLSEVGAKAAFLRASLLQTRGSLRQLDPSCKSTVVALHAVVISSETVDCGTLFPGTCRSVPHLSAGNRMNPYKDSSPLVRFYCIVRCSEYINYNPILARRPILLYICIYSQIHYISTYSTSKQGVLKIVLSPFCGISVSRTSILC